MDTAAEEDGFSRLNPQTTDSKHGLQRVGWKVSPNMTAQLVIEIFNQARRRAWRVRAGQYAAVEFRRLLYVGGFRQSMSRKENCYDNAQAESFFSRFKAEPARMESLNRSRMREKSSAISKAITTGRDYIRVWVTKAGGVWKTSKK